MGPVPIMTDPYEILGLSKTASDDDIRKAYRKLAKKYHTDLNPGKADAEARFKDISAANALLSDPEKRARFDRGEIDASGAETPRNFYRGFADAGVPGAMVERSILSTTRIWKASFPTCSGIAAQPAAGRQGRPEPRRAVSACGAATSPTRYASRSSMRSRAPASV